MSNVGIVGLGLLGLALADRLIAAGYTVIGYDLSDTARDAAAVAGVKVAGSAAEIAGACDVLLLSLPDALVVATVLEGVANGLACGRLVIDASTGAPWQVAATGARLAQRGVEYLDATVAGSSAQLRAGDVVVMAGGTAEAFHAAEPLLATFARQSFHLGGWGTGSQMKLVVNLVLGLNRAVLAEGLSLASALALDPAIALEVLRASAAYSTVMDTKGPKMLAEDFSPQARLSQHLKDVRLILEAAERTGTRLPLSLLHRTLLEGLERAGHGGLDNSAILLAFRDPPQST